MRCIKPNMNKTPDDYDEKMVLDQLRYLGMLEIIRIRKMGFPVHFTFVDFVSRYKCILDTQQVRPTTVLSGHCSGIFLCEEHFLSKIRSKLYPWQMTWVGLTASSGGSLYNSLNYRQLSR